eukprot:CAMPEP_0204260468 /NCGR_PEP_ID=MMETSP0468-20130131/6355_1 /ASSEMBLY_ACC=CAM_ASM_000383 /TAXON_ID=2969 /ORGANISM="Oxyrrhis marina" /LENGTH=85 /DNA_ID=CAMNT_0051234905 /DNA_START=58 /DNA_END=315 /DNA_ORIENTATION=-
MARGLAKQQSQQKGAERNAQQKAKAKAKEGKKADHTLTAPKCKICMQPFVNMPKDQGAITQRLQEHVDAKHAKSHTLAQCFPEYA